MKIEDFHNKHIGQRCFILGSGPSLTKMDLSGLKDEITFSCNRGYLLFERLGFPTTYWALEDFLDFQQFDFNFTGPTKFVAADLPLKNSCAVPFLRDEFGFSTDPPFKFGGTVTHFMLQLAVYMGCSQALLLGNDFKWASNGGITDIDTDHFDANYWPKGSQSFPPQPERMRRAFLGARGHGLRIVDLTPGSALDVFERADYQETLVNGLAPLPREHQHPTEVHALAELAKGAKHVIEIGVLEGGTCARWHELCSGLVIGIDKTKRQGLEERFPRLRLVDGNSHSEATLARVKELLNGELADMLFIDGDHSYEGTRLDHRDYGALVRPGGVIAFHDINAHEKYFEEWEQGGSPRYWQELEGQKQEFTINDVWGGIGVLKV